MKKLKQTVLTITAAVGLALTTQAQTAELQVIHNAADPTASSVDVYVNGTPTLDNFAFRTATSFLTLPAGVPLNIGVAPGNSTSANDTLKNFTVTLTSGERYIAVANGVLNPGSFSPNPDGASTSFTLFLQDNIRSAAVGSDVDFIALHGASDAPTVDVIARNVATLVDDAAYGDITGYVSVPPASYTLDVTASAGTPIVASFMADLSGLGGGSAVVFASGFLDPSQNQNGPAFGLFAALANGTVVQFPAVSLAHLQVIHNAADPAASNVDVYVNGSITLDDFGFRTATTFLEVPADVVLNIGVAPGNSVSVNDTLKNFEVTLANGGVYTAIANGVLNPGSFASNPDGQSTAFTLFLQDQMRTAAMNSGEVDFRAVHGASDAPTVDVIARNVATLVDDAVYGAITGYVSVPAASYTLDVTASAGTPIVASFTADLSALGGGSAVVFASGFLDSTQNQNGAAFGLFAALADGTVVPFPAVSLAQLQVIHNAADPAAASVDVYVNGTLTLDDFAFRTASAYLEVPADVVLNIGVAGGNSASVTDTIKNFEVTLENGGVYVAIANGVLSTGDFASNPDGRSTAFTLFLQDGMRAAALNSGEVDFRAVHGASDAPTVDVVARNVTTLVDDAGYGDITSYVSVPAGSYTLDVTAAAGTPTVASFVADLSTLGGGSGVVLASGFLDPATNQNGPGFTLILVLADGTVLVLSTPTGIEDAELSGALKVYPIPATDVLTIGLEEYTTESTYELINSAGQVVRADALASGPTSLPVSDLAQGVYLVRVESNGGTAVRKVIIK